MNVRSFGQLEARIMAAIWAGEGPMTVKDIVACLADADDADDNPASPAAYSTVITVVERLRAKEWLTRQRAGKAYLYTATATEDEYTARLMNRVLDETGDRTAALLHFAGRLHESEADALRVALSRLQDER